MEFLSDEWCRAVNDAAADFAGEAAPEDPPFEAFTLRLELGPAGSHPSRVAAGYRARFEAGARRLQVEPLGSTDVADDPATTVTLVIDPDTAAAMAQGTMPIASAMAEGGVKVRGPVRLLADRAAELSALAAATRAVTSRTSGAQPPYAAPAPPTPPTPPSQETSDD